MNQLIWSAITILQHQFLAKLGTFYYNLVNDLHFRIHFCTLFTHFFEDFLEQTLFAHFLHPFYYSFENRKGLFHRCWNRLHDCLVQLEKDSLEPERLRNPAQEANKIWGLFHFNLFCSDQKLHGLHKTFWK